MARTPLMAGNWKMNLDHHEAVQLLQKLAWSLDDAQHDYGVVEVAVCPSFTNLRSVQTLIDADKLGIVYGAQDVSAHEKGAYTGEISGTQLAKLGVRYVIVGHSERRQYHAESDELVGTKAKVALGHGLTPIICVGEGLDVRKKNEHVPYTLAQVDGAYADLSADDAVRTVIAYEPVWAIGTGEVATPDDAQEVCAAIRGRLVELYDQSVADTVRILYGGSVKGSNSAEIMGKPDVDGGLVGGASLDAEEFASIVRNAAG
jgi:triosephosphate isomerase